jgi:hypothetical protein
VRPDAGDAERVRRYAAQKSKKELAADYEKMAVIISEVYHPRNGRTELLALDTKAMSPALSRQIREAVGRLGRKDPATPQASQLLAAMREQLGLSRQRSRCLMLFCFDLILHARLLIGFAFT